LKFVSAALEKFRNVFTNLKVFNVGHIVVIKVTIKHLTIGINTIEEGFYYELIVPSRLE